MEVLAFVEVLLVVLQAQHCLVATFFLVYWPEPVARQPDPDHSVPEFTQAQRAAADALRGTLAAGGFTLMGESVAPLMHDPNDAAGRDELGLAAEELIAAGAVATLDQLRDPAFDLKSLLPK